MAIAPQIAHQRLVAVRAPLRAAIGELSAAVTATRTWTGASVDESPVLTQLATARGHLDDGIAIAGPDYVRVAGHPGVFGVGPALERAGAGVDSAADAVAALASERDAAAVAGRPIRTHAAREATFNAMVGAQELVGGFAEYSIGLLWRMRTGA